ncbi:MAG: nucleotidyltransferase family protein [Parabacteroides sp.]|nr:nucleotidyltransferase family protein [Parabacteroides sp.]
MEGIILAGGFGTRLQSVVSDVPKCMAPVNGKPFLHYLLAYLERAGFTHLILALGYKHEIVEEWLATYPTEMKLTTVTENEPLGTGGAVKLASQAATEAHVFILNGDTYFEVDYRGMLRAHRAGQQEATLALRKMTDFNRYGTVETDPGNRRIIRFREKQPCREGYINGGVYLLRKEAFGKLPAKGSLEKEYFEKRVGEGIFTGFYQDGYFIDIGIPEDYDRFRQHAAR